MKWLEKTFRLAVATVMVIATLFTSSILGQATSTTTESSLSVGSKAGWQEQGFRTITFETSEVTAPDVAVTPDGEWLIFTMLGKLFRLSVKGGEAEQLTFGPYYDNDPAISPDGTLVAFESDRDGSEGNIFILTLATKEIKQLTREAWAERAAWSPDGRSLLYMQRERAAWDVLGMPDRRQSLPRPPALLRRISISDYKAETIRPMASVGQAFFLPDGKIAWTSVERNRTNQRTTTRIEFLRSDNQVGILRTFEGGLGAIVTHKKADGFYATYSKWDAEPHLIFVPILESAEQRITPVSGEAGGFAVLPDNKTLFVGNIGRLWKVALPGGGRQGIPLHARVALTIREATLPPKWSPPRPGTHPPLRTISSPQLSPDGSRIVFHALGELWEQPLNGGAARRLPKGEGNRSSHTFSSDWGQMAYVLSSQNKSEIQVLDLKSGKTKTVAPPTECGYEQLSWSKHGELIAATACDHDIIAIDTGSSSVSTLQKTKDWNYWETYPQLSDDGKTLYFQASIKGSDPAVYRLRLEPNSKPEPVAPAAGDGVDMKLNGDWIAYPVPNQSGIRLARRDGNSSAGRTFTEADGHEFSFTPDGTALIYVAGGKLWRQPLNGGSRSEIPIRFQENLAIPPPVLIERVRVLDFNSGGFTSETSLLLHGGRITWIGSPAGHEVPAGTVKVDGGGRFAIPGLFDTHGHQGGCGFAPYISYGITSVRNMGNRLELQNAHADRGDFTGDPVSRCFYAGRIIEGVQGRDEDWYFVHPRNEDEARTYVRSWKAQGAQFIKLYQRLPWPFHRAAADEARRLGLPVVAHGNGVELSVKGVTLGYAGLTHWRPFYQDVVQMFKTAGTWWEPTMGGIAGWGVSFRNDPIRFKDVSWANPQIGDSSLKGLWAELLRTMRSAHNAGITLLPGTDGGPGGINVHWELEYYAEAGILPIDVLRLATKDAAKTVGADDHLGSLEPGKLADILLLDANPLEDIKNTQKIWRVFKGGWMFDPKVLRPGGN